MPKPNQSAGVPEAIGKSLLEIAEYIQKTDNITLRQKYNIVQNAIEKGASITDNYPAYNDLKTLYDAVIKPSVSPEIKKPPKETKIIKKLWLGGIRLHGNLFYLDNERKGFATARECAEHYGRYVEYSLNGKKKKLLKRVEGK